MPAISALIPTRGRPAALARCVAGLATDVAAGVDAEVVVGLDGPDAADPAAIRAAWSSAGGPPAALRVEILPRAGYIPVRHRLLPTLRGRIYLSLNDDVAPEPGFLAAHLEAHARLGGDAIVVGDSRFAPPPDPTLLDALVAEDDLVFFWGDVVRAAEGGPALGWRHAFGLNCSMPRDAALAAGGYPDLAEVYGYDDIALARRLELPVVPCLAARALHHHRHALDDLLSRETALGRAAVAWAHASPELMLDLLGLDLRDAAVRAELDRTAARLAADAARAETALRGVAGAPAHRFDRAVRDAVLAAYRLPKRVRWMRGVADA